MSKWERNRQEILRTLHSKFGDVDVALEWAARAGVDETELRRVGEKDPEAAVQLLMNAAEIGRVQLIGEHAQANQEREDARVAAELPRELRRRELERRITALGEKWKHPDHQHDPEVVAIKEGFRELYPGEQRASYTNFGQSSEVEPEGEGQEPAPRLMNIGG
jgi:hypothetical protein